MLFVSFSKAAMHTCPILMSFGSGLIMMMGSGRANSMDTCAPMSVSLYMMMHRSVIMIAHSTIKNDNTKIKIINTSCIGKVGTIVQSIKTQQRHKK